jgi:DNA repair exonuclease SbcCD ATPase subunit
MRYPKLTLDGYNRMALNVFDNFTIELSAPVQLILGTNGSGKSSLVGELSPMPAESSDFKKEGRKVIHIEKKRSQYVLTSSFSPTTRHSFVKDGEELNKGGTVSVQKELVFQEFGIDAEIHKLLVGRSKFTQMAAPKRREWFTRMSVTSYDYAIQLFMKIKDRHRDITGALKLAKKRLVSENAKIVPLEEREALEREVNELYELVQKMNDFRMPVEKDPRELFRMQEQTIEALQNIARSSMRRLMKLKMNTTVSSKLFKSTQDIEQRINALKNQFEVDNSVRKQLCASFEKIEKTMGSLVKTGMSGVGELADKIAKKEVEKETLRAQRNILKGYIEDPEGAMRAYETVVPIIEATLLEMPSNSDRRFTPAARDECTQKLNELNDHIERLEHYIKDLTSRKAHQETHKNAEKVECPKCNHLWALGFSELIYKDVSEKLAQAEKDLPGFLAKRQELQKFQEEVNEYLKNYRNIFNYFTSWPILKPLWDHLISSSLILNNPSQACQQSSLFLVDLNAEIKCSLIDREIKQIADQKALKEAMGNQDMELLASKQKELEEEIHERTTAMQEAQRECQVLESYLSELRQVEKSADEIKRLMALGENYTSDGIENERRERFLQCIREIQSNLARKEKVLSEVTMQSGIIRDLENQILELEADEIATKALMRELSPTDGLIAEGLMGFIKSFVGQMNSFIKKIWAYPLQIVPCQIESDGSVDLDYKFPVIVKERSNKIGDVQFGSTGMKEVIDLAFSITSMKYLGLSESPLYLDEFTGTMDKDHRHNAIMAIKSLMETQGFTQLFIISHNLEFHGAFSNAQLCVLNKDNIAIPANMTFNEHVQMS